MGRTEVEHELNQQAVPELSQLNQRPEEQGEMGVQPATARQPSCQGSRVTKLSVVDELFHSTGTARVKVTKHGREQILEIPIKSVQISDVETAVAHLKPKIPKKRERIEKERQWVTVLDTANDEYQAKVADYDRALMRTWVFMSIDVDIEDAHGRVVWSADNSVQDYEAADAALVNMGLTDAQLVSIFRAASDLTRLDEEEIEQD